MSIHSNPSDRRSATSRRLTLLATTMAAGLASMAMPTALAVLAGLTPQQALAQDYSSGALAGTVTDAGGSPVGGAAVKVKSLAQGFQRDLVTDADGRFRIALIPSGGYAVSISKAGYQPINDSNVRVTVGSTANFGFTINELGASVSEVVVTGAANPQLDFAGTTTGLVVDVENLTKQVPIARNVTSLVLLAPSAVPGDSSNNFVVQGQSQPAVGGASVGENVFYINGLNITNFVNGIGAAVVPFEFYKSVEVKTGGYPAEFGRGTGAMINAVTKSGSNDFTFAIHGNYEPNAWREEMPNTTIARNSLAKRTDNNFTVEAGGPIIPDRLFFYGLATFQNLEVQNATNNTAPGAVRSGVTQDRTADPFYAFKLDAYVTDRQHLEFTYFDTSRKRKRDSYQYLLANDQILPQRASADSLYQGGENYVARYTGTFTDWLTVSAAYGRSEVDNKSVGDLPNESLVQDARTGTAVTVSRQASSSATVPSLAEREFYRADVDLYFKLVGDHHIRAGFDEEKTLLTQFTVRNGERNWIYRKSGSSGAQGGAIAPNQEYLELRRFETGGGYNGKNRAFYIQDAWDVTDRLTLNLGVRKDQFAVSNPSGVVFASFDNEIALRLGFAYDLFGARTDKLYGSYGRTYLPVASNTAFRAASAAIDVSEFFLPKGGAGATFTYDPLTGKPIGGLGPQVTWPNTDTNLDPCTPALKSIAAPGTIACFIRNDGISPQPDEVSALNLKSTYQDEYIVGYEHRFNALWKAGVNLTYRNLGRVSEDAVMDYAVRAWCSANGYAQTNASRTGCTDIWSGSHQFLIINPGSDVKIKLAGNLPGETTARTITLSAEQMAFPKAKREYLGVEFNFDREFDGKWGLRGSYVLSESKGNFEGAARSDNGQTDAGITVDFDRLAYVPGTYGLLPNHRGHQIKLFGSYAVIEDLMIGGNLSVLSPRKYGCIGLAPPGSAPDASDANANGANARFCGGKLVNRGTSFDSDWITRFDVSLRYTVPAKYVPVMPVVGSKADSNLVLRADVFNLFNLQGGTDYDEFGETGGGLPSATYGQVRAYQTPRSIRLGFDWQF
ncbi:MAG: TonB-dependent receptor [Caulobacter sp.]|nr:TonB-dependent receptor [Caulobacter sp.]